MKGRFREKKFSLHDQILFIIFILTISLISHFQIGFNFKFCSSTRNQVLLVFFFCILLIRMFFLMTSDNCGKHYILLKVMTSFESESKIFIKKSNSFTTIERFLLICSSALPMYTCLHFRLQNVSVSAK